MRREFGMNCAAAIVLAAGTGIAKVLPFYNGSSEVSINIRKKCDYGEFVRQQRLSVILTVRKHRYSCSFGQYKSGRHKSKKVP